MIQYTYRTVGRERLNSIEKPLPTGSAVLIVDYLPGEARGAEAHEARDLRSAPLTDCNADSLRTVGYLG